MSRPPAEAKGFGKRVQTTRLERGWSQDELAEQADLSRPTVSRVERGEDPSMRTARKLAMALDLSVEITGQEEK